MVQTCWLEVLKGRWDRETLRLKESRPNLRGQSRERNSSKVRSARWRIIWIDLTETQSTCVLCLVLDLTSSIDQWSETGQSPVWRPLSVRGVQELNSLTAQCIRSIVPQFVISSLPANHITSFLFLLSSNWHRGSFQPVTQIATLHKIWCTTGL